MLRRNLSAGILEDVITYFDQGRREFGTAVKSKTLIYIRIKEINTYFAYFLKVKKYIIINQ